MDNMLALIGLIICSLVGGLLIGIGTVRDTIEIGEPVVINKVVYTCSQRGLK